MTHINNGPTRSPIATESDRQTTKKNKLISSFSKGRKVIVKKLSKLNCFINSESKKTANLQRKKLDERKVSQQPVHYEGQSKAQQGSSKSLKNRLKPPTPYNNKPSTPNHNRMTVNQPIKDNNSSSPIALRAQGGVSHNQAITTSDVIKISKDMHNKLASMSRGLHSGNDQLHSNERLAGKGRFSGTKPPVNTAIHLDSFNKPTHANKIDDRTIAAQGPSVFKKDQESIPAFFSMAYEQDVNTVVNLTNHNDYNENDNPPLAVEYWPQPGSTEHYSTNSHHITVTTTNIEQKDDYKVVTLELLQKPKLTAARSAEKKIVTLYHYHSWKDHQATELNKILNVKQEIDQQPEIRKIVHCRAGVGRTGTYIMLDQLKIAHRRGELTLENLKNKIEDMVFENRKKRGKMFVQKAPQFQLIYSYGLKLLGVSEADDASPSFNNTTHAHQQNIKPRPTRSVLTASEHAAPEIDRSKKPKSVEPPPLPPKNKNYR